MSDEPVWVSRRALLLLHEESLAEFGGARGLHDPGLLDSALERARNRWAYAPASTLAELAAAYGFALAKNHAFLDGNKRMAFLAMGLFLALNGQRLIADRVEAVEVIEAVAAGTLDEPRLAAWIAGNTEAGGDLEV